MLPGKVKVDIDYIAMKLKMAKSTVSKALNGRPDVSEATKEKVRLFAKKLNYTPDRLAQSLKTRRSDLVGVVMHEMKHEFFVEIARSVTREAQAHGFQAVFASSEGSAENEKAIIQDLVSRRIDGLIVIPCMEGGHGHLKELAGEGYPLVVVDNYVEGVPAPFVGTDFEEGARLAVEKLLHAGCRRLGFLLGPASLSSTAERLAGATKALKSAGLEIDSAYVRHCGYDVAAADHAAMELLSVFPDLDALICANVDIGEGAAVALTRLDRLERTPLVDFGGARPESVDQRNEEIGRIAAQLLIRLIEGGEAPARTLVSPRLTA